MIADARSKHWKQPWNEDKLCFEKMGLQSSSTWSRHEFVNTSKSEQRAYTFHYLPSLVRLPRQSERSCRWWGERAFFTARPFHGPTKQRHSIRYLRLTVQLIHHGTNNFANQSGGQLPVFQLINFSLYTFLFIHFKWKDKHGACNV